MRSAFDLIAALMAVLPWAILAFFWWKLRGFERPPTPRPAPAPHPDTARLDWAVRRSAQLFRRETPDPLVMLAFFPMQQDGFIAAEVEGRAIPAQTCAVRLAEVGGNEDLAIRLLIDAARAIPERSAVRHA